MKSCWYSPLFSSYKGNISRDYEVADLVTLAVMQDHGAPCLKGSWSGTIIGEAETDDIAAMANVRCITVHDQGDDDYEYTYVGEDHAYMQILSSDEGFIAITLITRDQAAFDAVKAWCDDNLSKGKPRGSCYTIVQTQQGVATSFLDFAGADLERGNYPEKIIKQFDYSVSQLSSSEPTGRVMIIDGPTGSGKTSLVRGLIQEVEDAIFVVIPQGMLESLVGPGMINMLIDLKDEDRPIIFVLEDADDALVPRDGGNISLISALLNMGDGILGQALNIRIICTTNARADQIDSAIMRPGRLIAHMHVGALPVDFAKGVLARINPEATLPERQERKGVGFGTTSKPSTYTIAEIYEAARKACQLEESDG